MNLGAMPTVAITMVLIAAVFTAGFLVVAGLQDSLTADTVADNATDDIVEGMANITSYAPTWGTIIGVAVLLGIVIGGFALGVVGYNAGKQRGYF